MSDLVTSADGIDSPESNLSVNLLWQTHHTGRAVGRSMGVFDDRSSRGQLAPGPRRLPRQEGKARVGRIGRDARRQSMGLAALKPRWPPRRGHGEHRAVRQSSSTWKRAEVVESPPAARRRT